MTCPPEVELIFRLREQAQLAAFIGVSLEEIQSLPVGMGRRLMTAHEALTDYRRYVAQRSQKG